MLEISLSKALVSGVCNCPKTFSKSEKSDFVKNEQNPEIFCKSISSPIYYTNNVRKVSFQSRQETGLKLGCVYDEKTKELNFNLRSNNAEKIKLYIFDKPIDGKVIKEIEMKDNNGLWSAKIDKEEQNELNLDIKQKKPLYYGFRAWGPNWQYDKNWTVGTDLGFISHVDSEGNRFNPNKLLTDPYAKELSHDPVSPERGYLNDTPYATGDSYYLEDSAPKAPKGIFVYSDKTETGLKPQRALKDDIIYEVNLRGFTMNDKNIPEKYRGTYKGAAMKAAYLKEMGYTMVEFLPVQEFQNEHNDLPEFYENGQDYWGYNSLNFFSPERRYAYDKSAGGPTREFKEMVKAFHDKGIKVCLDVVYNHTGEGSTWKDTDTTKLLSLKGLDNQSYYELTESGKHFWDNTGCGANLNAASKDARDLILDATEYWTNEMGVDALRHDLAPVLGNRIKKHGFQFDAKNQSNYLNKVKEKIEVKENDQRKEGVDLIAEPWACGDGTFQEGNFPRFWNEWSSRYKDSVRSIFNRQENTPVGVFASAISGMSSTFGGEKTRSINFISCHDGFTLKDLFSFNKKNNNIEGFTSDGGSDYEISWNNFNNSERQKKAVRNAIMTLMLSKGTPMMLGGDEFMRSQLGNNNTYNQDKPLNYLNWDLDKTQKMMRNFTKKMIEFRKEHKALTDLKYYNGKDNNKNSLKDITWLKPDSNEADSNYFNDPNNHFLGFRIDGTEFGDSAVSIYAALNKGDYNVEMKLPKNLKGKHWYFVADTSEFSEKIGNFIPSGVDVSKLETNNISPRSMMLFIEK